jgi:ABC-2 type transport system permease protein
MKIFSLYRKDLLLLLRNRGDMAVLFLMPLAFIIPISLALGAGDGYGVRANDRMMILTVVNYDNGPRAQAFLTSVGTSLSLEQEIRLDLLVRLGLDYDTDCALPPDDRPTGAPACMEKAGYEMLRRSWRPAVLLLPPNFSQAVDAGEKVEIVLMYDPAGDAIQIQQIEGVVKGAAMKISLQNQVQSGFEQLNQMAALAPEQVRQSVAEQGQQPAPANQQQALRLVKVSPQNARLSLIPDTYQQTIPGYTVMYVFFIITSLASSVQAERVHGTFRRLFSAPVRSSDIMAGKMLSTLTVGLLQVLLLFAVGALIFGLRLGNDPLAFLLLTLALVAAAASIGMAAATTRLRGGGLAAPLIISAVLGGSMFPLDLMPPFLRSLSRLTPHSWALTGYQNLMVRGQGLQEVMPQIAVLAGFALVFFIIAARRFDFEHQEAE